MIPSKKIERVIKICKRYLSIFGSKSKRNTIEGAFGCKPMAEVIRKLNWILNPQKKRQKKYISKLESVFQYLVL